MEVERLNVRRHGYGAAAFGRNLHEAFERLSERGVSESDLKVITALASDITRQEMQLMADVAVTVPRLAQRHELTLFTKGQAEEQQLKVDRSGLAAHFDRILIAPEKDVAAYQGLVAEHGLDPARTWMVGNSPRSDINPALEAGLGAVFIPHSRTWALELAEIRPSPRLIVLGRFAELAEHF
jgi:putative hydrolase of the HAD superfamily